MRFTVVLGSLLVFLCSTSALAYRPPARVLVLKAMQKQIDRGTKSMRVDAETQLFDVAGGARGTPFQERFFFNAPGSARRETDLPEGTRIEVRVDERQLVRAPGQADKAGKAAVDLLTDLVTTAPPLNDEQGADRFLRGVKALGVNTEVVSFARFDGRIAYLIGSKPWEKDKPQIWLDKDTLLLLRVVMITKGDDGKPKRTDVRYLGWGSPIGGHWFPAMLEVYSDEKLVRRTRVKNVERNQSLDATIFSLK